MLLKCLVLEEDVVSSNFGGHHQSGARRIYSNLKYCFSSTKFSEMRNVLVEFALSLSPYAQ